MKPRAAPPEAASSAALAVAPPPAITWPTVEAAADAALEYGFPLTEVMRVCDLHPSVNQIYMNNRLATPQSRQVVRPNNDTVYGYACAYLGDSWVKITMPPAKGRYMSMQVFDAYTTTAAVRGPAEIPPEGAAYVLRLRGAAAADLPADAAVIDVETPFAFVLFRTLVNGPSDLADAVAAQTAIGLTANAGGQPDRSVKLDATTPAQEMFENIALRLAQNPPPAAEAALVASFARAGIMPSRTPSLAGRTPEQLAAWESAFTRGAEKLTRASQTLGAGGGSVRGTWSFPSPNIATPGTDYALRALTARSGLFALPPSESIYPSTTGDGNTPQVLHLPASWPPIDPRGFWSLTMYDAEGYFVDNAVDRYAISNRTPKVRFERDGSLKIYIQCRDPGGAKSANWLPAPCGRFSITMRLYLPTAAARDPGFTLPPLQ